MKSGQTTVPEGKISIAAGRSGALTGILLVAVLLPLPLGAAIDRREPSRIAVTAASGGRFPYVASGPDDVLPDDVPIEVSDAVVPPVKRVVPKTPDAPADDAAPPPSPPETDEPAKAGDNIPWTTHELSVLERVEDWLARANREFQTTVIRRLSTPPAGTAADDEIARKIEEVKAEDAAAAKRTAAAEEARKAAEAERHEEARRAAEAAQATAPPPVQPAPQAETKPDDSARLAEEMKQERARLEAEADRIETQRKAAEAQRKADETKRLEEERAKIAAAKLEDDRRRAAAEAEKNAAAAAEQKAAAEAEKKSAESERKAAAAAADAANAAAAAAEKAATAAEKRAAVEAEKEQKQARAVELTRQAAPPSPPPAAAPSAASSPPPTVGTATIVPPVASASEPEDDQDLKTKEPPARHASSDRPAASQASNDLAHGPVVKRWAWRAGHGRCRDAGRRISLPGRYTVARGDSLWLISRRFYRTGWLYRKIYRANRAIIRDPDLIYPCQRLYVPRRH